MVQGAALAERASAAAAAAAALGVAPGWPAHAAGTAPSQHFKGDKVLT